MAYFLRDLGLWKNELSLLIMLISYTKCPVGKNLFKVNNEVIRIASKENVSVW